MKIFFINMNGGGFANNIEVADGMTVAQLFAQQMPADTKAEDYLIRVNRQPCGRDEVLTEGARVSITPTKIDGARQAA